MAFSTDANASSSRVKPLDEECNENCKHLSTGCSSLMYACQQGHTTAIVKELRTKPKSIYQRDKSHKSALHYCSGQRDLVAAASVAVAAPELLESADEDGFTPLHLAVIQGNMALVNLLLANKADVHALDNEGHSVVHWATVCGEIEALRAVLGAGADVSIPDRNGGSPLHYAAQMCGASYDGRTCQQSHKLALEILSIILLHPKSEVNVVDKDGRQPLLWAASAGSAKAVLALVNAGSRVDSADKDGLTALHCAASRGHTECIDTLISLCGAPTDLIDSNGCTALHYAVTLGHADATSLLLDLEADPNRQDRKGRTPAHCGCAKGQLETVRMLRERRANMWLRNSKGDLPIHEAASSGRRELVQWLLEQRPKQVNITSNDGRSLLHIAAGNDNTDMCKMLLDYGADVNCIYRANRNIVSTPLDCALQKGFRSTAKFLQLHGGLPASKLRLSAIKPNALNDQELVTPLNFKGPTSGILNQEIVDGKDCKKFLVYIDRSESEENSCDQEQVQKRTRKSRSRCHHHRHKYRLRTSSCETFTIHKDDSSSDICRSKSNIEIHRRRKSRHKKESTSPSDSSSSDHCCRYYRKDRHKHRRKETSKKYHCDSSDSDEECHQRKRRDKRRKRDRSPEIKENGGNGKQNEAISVEQKTDNKDSGQRSAKTGKTSSQSQEKVNKQKSGNDKNDKSSTVQTSKSRTTSASKRPQSAKGSAKKSNKTLDASAEKDAKDGKDMKDTKDAKNAKDIAHVEGSNNQSQNSVQLEMATNNERFELNKDTLSEAETPNTITTTAEVHHPNEEVKEEVKQKADVHSVEEGKKERVDTVEVGKIDTVVESQEKPNEQIIEENKQSLIVKSVSEVKIDEESSKNIASGQEIKSSEQSSEAVKSTKEDKSEENLATETNENSTAILDTTAKSHVDATQQVMQPEVGKQSEVSNQTEINKTIEVDKKSGNNKQSEEVNSKANTENVPEDQNFSVIPGQSAQEKIDLETSRPTDEPRKSSFTVLASDESVDIVDEFPDKDAQEKSFHVLEHSEKDNIDDEYYSSDDVDDEENLNEYDGMQPVEQGLHRRRFKNVKQYSVDIPSKTLDKTLQHSKDQDSGFEPSPRTMRTKIPTPQAIYTTVLPRKSAIANRDRRRCVSELDGRKPGDRNSVNMNMVTQSIQKNIKRYYMERKIFQHLLELKSLQIRSSKINESVLVKRAVDDYHKSTLALGWETLGGGSLRRYPYKDYTFKNFEIFLYETLKSLQKTGTYNFQNISDVYKEAERRLSPNYRRYEKALHCTTKTHRCLHAAHAYTGIPCAAYIPMMNHHTMPKYGFGSLKNTGLGSFYLPKILTKKNGKGASNKVSLELSHGNNKQLISLPSEKLDSNKRYYVTFTVKGNEHGGPASDGDSMKATPPPQRQQPSGPSTTQSATVTGTTASTGMRATAISSGTE